MLSKDKEIGFIRIILNNITFTINDLKIRYVYIYY